MFDFLKKILGFIFPGVYMYTEPYNLPAVPDDVAISNSAWSLANRKLRSHEGYRRDVYKDSLGLLTVGIGHRVLLSDQLQFGDEISDGRVEELFKQDAGKAFNAAKAQAKEAGKFTPEMIAALTSVNFQLGTGWRSKFPSTWNDIKNGNLQSAISRLLSSSWNKQTPVRVSDFIQTLQTEFA